MGANVKDIEHERAFLLGNVRHAAMTHTPALRVRPSVECGHLVRTDMCHPGCVCLLFSVLSFLQVGITQPIITMETRDFEHVKEIVEALQAEGFTSTRLDTPEP